MSSNETLNCYRCEKVATTYIPEKNRTLCDTHLFTFKEAYASIAFSSVEINDSNVEAIQTLLPKEATELSVGLAESPRVPVKLIIDHLAELATGTEPATCKVCGKPMQLHSQFSPTKQAGLTEKELQGVTHPDFLANFADGGRGVCLSCNGSGFNGIIDKPSDIRTIYKHINDDREGQGHYKQLMDLMSSLKNVDKDTAIKGNLPFVVTRFKNFDVNPQFDSSKISEFPFPVAGYHQFDFTQSDPHKMLHTLFHAIGQVDDRYETDHGHVDSLESPEVKEVLCDNCGGHGQHPLISDPDVADKLEELYQKSLEIPRDVQRRRKPTDVSKADFGILNDTSNDELPAPTSSRTAHSGPGIKPHDHHHKPHTYKKHQQGPGSAPSNSSPSGKGRRGLPKMPGIPGGGGGKKPFQLPPIERWIYNQMNMFHDISHTEYKTPSYMYRNPNPMYYSIPRRQWGDSKPWRN